MSRPDPPAPHIAERPGHDDARRAGGATALDAGELAHDASTDPKRLASGGAWARYAAPAKAGLRALGGVPMAAWVCALVAIVNAACWSVISPPFQLPDEPSHFAYVQHMAETGHLPSSNGLAFPPAEEAALIYVLQAQVRFSPENHTIASRASQQTLERALALPLSRSRPGDAGMAAAEPPFYYALETLPYLLGSGGTVLDRLALMRLLSVLFGGLTALFCFLFLREALPGTRWAWTVGGLGVALNPVLGMMSGAVNPDALLFAVSSALFYCLARAFRRGFTRRSAIAIGAVLAMGCVTKVTFLGLMAGAIVALFVLARREARASGESAAYGHLALALLVAVLPAGAYLLDDALSAQSTLKFIAGRTAPSTGHHRSIAGAIGYIWQLYLPGLPGMTPVFHGTSADRIWFEQIVGKYGWLDTTFPPWVVTVALIPAAGLAVLLVRALAASRRVLWMRRAEVAVFALLALGLLAIVGADEYRDRVPGEYMQLRYLMPAIALGGAGIALAARGAGRRWGPIAGVCIVLLVLAHDLLSQLLVIARYYG
jgi:4-amino-4-deoxy-L-arabinose transferase-like glycosyltransferase